MEQYVYKNQKALRCGITTGTCAAAGAMSAAMLLLLGIERDSVMVNTPKGIDVNVPVKLISDEEGRSSTVGAEEKILSDMVTAERPTGFAVSQRGSVTCMVVKDSGDDPDVTNGTKIYVTVEKMYSTDKTQSSVNTSYRFTDKNYPGLYLDGGVGIGRVTRDGLEQRIGQAAINVVPRRMIFEAVWGICRMADYKGELLITVSIPEGALLAEKTFNPKLGIKGGLSVLGTSGIIEPMSEQAIVATIETEIRQQISLGKDMLLIAPGNYGQSYIEEQLGIKLKESIKCSNYIGETLDLAVSYGAKKLLLVGNIGKLVKLAAGIMNTHSRVADARLEIMAIHTVLCGGDRRQAEHIMGCINTEEVLTCLNDYGLKDKVIDSICKKIYEHIRHRVGGQLEFGVMLFSEKYGYLGQTQGSSRLVNYYKNNGE